MKLTEQESILLMVSEYDAAKIPMLKRIDKRIVEKVYYEKLRKNLNTTLAANSLLEHNKKLKPSG